MINPVDAPSHAFQPTTLCWTGTLSGEKVATALDKVLLQRGVPESITALTHHFCYRWEVVAS